MAHWVDPNGKQITEFAGANDDCGPCANEVALATVQQRSPTTAHMNAIRARDIQAGIMRKGSGQNVYELVRDVQMFEKGVTVKQTPTSVNFIEPGHAGEPNAAYFEVVHQALRAALSRHNACVINLGNAKALPGNEGGVQWHFVTCIGIDDALGYLICNGDEIPFDGVPNWVSWKQLLPARPVAIVEYLKGASPVSNPTPAPLPSPSSGVLPDGWHDDGKLLLAPNGMAVVRGFRTYVLARPDLIASLGEPLEPEHGTPDVGLDGSRGAGSVQLWQRGGLGWTAKDGVFPLWAGLMAFQALKQIDTLEGQVMALQDQIAAMQAKGNVSSEAASAISVVDHLIDHLKIYGGFKSRQKIHPLPVAS